MEPDAMTSQCFFRFERFLTNTTDHFMMVVAVGAGDGYF
jgi:hypothetical protein